MNFNKWFSIVGFSLSLALIFSFKLFFKFPQPVHRALLLSLIISIMNTLVVLSSLRWAYARSNKIFYGTFFGGIIWKLLVLGITAYVIYGNHRFHLATTLISVVGFTFLFTFLGFPWISKIQKITAPTFN